MLLSTRQVAALLGVCTRTIQRRLADGSVSYHHFGGLVRIPSEQFQDLGDDSSVDYALQVLRRRGVRV